MKPEIKTNYSERKEEAREYINKKIKASNSDTIFWSFISFICVCTSVLIFLYTFIHTTDVSFAHMLFIVFMLLFSILVIYIAISSHKDYIRYTKYSEIIDTDVLALKDILNEIDNDKHKNKSPKEKIQDYLNEDPNCTETSEEKYSVILTTTYGNHVIDVTKYLEEKFSISLSEAHKLVRSVPTVIIESTTFDKATTIQQELISLGAGCTVEKYNPSITDAELKIKYDDGLLHCPRCGSTMVAIGQKGFSLFSGFWGSNKTVNRCGSCGYSWEPKL